MIFPFACAPRIAAGLFALLFGLFLVAGAPAQALDSAQTEKARAVVAGLADDLSTLASRSEAMPKADSVDKAQDILRDRFDLNRIAAATVGRSRFEKWTEAQRADYVDAFIRYTLASQTEALTRYEQDALTIKTIQEAPDDLVMVRALYSGGSEPSTVDFMVARNDAGRYQIVDLVIDGSVSQLQLRRAEFTSILKSRGYDGLVALLREKTEKLLARKS